MISAPSLRTLFRCLAPASKREPRFAADARAFRERLALWRPRLTATPQVGAARPGILVTPWLQTAVPFFAIECALALAARGARPVLVFDATDVFANISAPFEVEEIRATLAALPPCIEVAEIAGTPAPASDAAEPAFLRTLVYENAVKAVRGEGGAEAFLAANPALAPQMAAHTVRVREFLRARAFDWLLTPGGIWALGGLYSAIATELGLDYTSYDSGYGTLFLAHRGVATHFGDIPHALTEVKRAAAEPERRWLIAEAGAQLRQRMAGEDDLRLQPQAASEKSIHRCDVLVPLNLRWDSAALCRQRLFPSVTAWLEQIITWTATHPGVAVAIRQHPCEKIPGFEGSDQFGELVARAGVAGVQFIGASAAVNSYDLMRHTRVVLPFTSRIGIESLMLGKPVVLGSHTYYGECAHAWNAESIPQYFELIDRALLGELIVPEAAREDAAITYFLAEKCIFLPTPFTPQPGDFEKWKAIPPAELWNTPESDDLLAALLTRERLAVLRYRRLSTPAA